MVRVVPSKTADCIIGAFSKFPTAIEKCNPVKNRKQIAKNFIVLDRVMMWAF